MKKLFASLVLFTLSCYLLQAQMPNIGSMASAGQLVTQLVNAIKPAAYTSAFSGAKDSVLGQAQKISSPTDMASTVSSLVGYIKPDMFNTGTTSQSLLALGSKAKTTADAAGLLKNFESGLKPDAFKSGWSGMRTGWLSALNQLALNQGK